MQACINSLVSALDCRLDMASCFTLYCLDLLIMMDCTCNCEPNKPFLPLVVLPCYFITVTSAKAKTTFTRKIQEKDKLVMPVLHTW